METTIKQIEDMSLNAWPSHKMELYDGWILRFSYFYTHRTNSVEQFGNSTLTWREKIPYCESVYKRLGTPAVFKISPLVSPDFDYVLENRGYAIQHTTNVMAMSMNAARLDAPYPDVTFCDNIPSEWIESLFRLKIRQSSKKPSVLPSAWTTRSSQPDLVFWTEIISASMPSMSKKNTANMAMPVRSAPDF